MADRHSDTEQNHIARIEEALSPRSDDALGRRAFLGTAAADRPDLDPARLPTPQVPVTVVHGTADETGPINVGDVVFDTFAIPIWYLRIDGATHSGVFGGEAGELFDEASLAFLAAELRGDDDALEAMAGTAEASGIADWRVRTAAG